MSGRFLKLEAHIKAIEDFIQIDQVPKLIKRGRYPVPIQFDHPSIRLEMNDFRDHYPITMSNGEH